MAAAGEPFRLFFAPDELEKELRRAGFQRIEQVDSDQLNERYFKDRADGLKLSAVRTGHAGYCVGVRTAASARQLSCRG